VTDKPLNAQGNTGDLPPAKQRQILDGARQVFLEVGFERACMDHIAARAEVSKATIYNHFLTTRDALALRRIILADTQRFPELGQALYDEGPLAMRHRLAAYLQEQADAGALRLEDAKLAAHQFILLCQGDLYLPVEYGILRDPPEERIRDTVRTAVRTFLRAYGPR